MESWPWLGENGREDRFAVVLDPVDYQMHFCSVPKQSATETSVWKACPSPLRPSQIQGQLEKFFLFYSDLQCLCQHQWIQSCLSVDFKGLM